VIFVLFDVTRNMQTTYPKILQSMGITHGITMVPILYPRTSACSTAHTPQQEGHTAEISTAEISNQMLATHCCRHTLALPHLLFTQASMSRSSTSSGNFMLYLFSHSSSKTNRCVV